MKICNKILNLSKKVSDFIFNVPNLGEESITDYLLWKWKEIDKTFHFIRKIGTINKKEEAQKGYDIELELWIVSGKYALPLLIQAKRAMPENKRTNLLKCYCSKALNYKTKASKTSKEKIQYETLITEAEKNNKLPMYLFYSYPDNDTENKCCDNVDSYLNKSSLYLTSAYKVRNKAKTCKGTTIYKKEILDMCIDFSCLFCCRYEWQKIIAEYKSYNNKKSPIRNIEEVPAYVTLLMNNELTEDNMSEINASKLAVMVLKENPKNDQWTIKRDLQW